MRWQINHIWGDRPGCWRCGVSGLSGHKQRAMQENVSSPAWERRGARCGGPPSKAVVFKTMDRKHLVGDTPKQSFFHF